MKKYDQNIQKKIKSLADKKIPDTQWNSEKTWDKLKQKLSEENKTRKLVPIYRNLSIAASILILLSLGLYLFFGQKSIKEKNIAQFSKTEKNINKKGNTNSKEESFTIKKQGKRQKIKIKERQTSSTQKQENKQVKKLETYQSFKKEALEIAKIDFEIEEKVDFELKIPEIKTPSFEKETKQGAILLASTDTKKQKLGFKLDVKLPKSAKKTRLKNTKKRKGKFKIRTNLNFKNSEVAENNSKIAHLKIKIK